MGIYDRDYIRREPPRRGAYGRGGPAGWRMWSVNTWLIVACVAVFVIDGLLPPLWVRMGPVRWAEGVDERVQELDDRLVLSPVRGAGGRAPVGYRDVALKTEDGGLAVVGRQDVQRMTPVAAWMHFSTWRGFFKIEFWRLIGFQFLHANLTHLIFNMIGLYFFGPMVERYLGSKRYLAFYLLCGIFGALMYVLLNVSGLVAGLVAGNSVRIPGLLFNDWATPLIGASAGVFGVLMAGAYLAPNARVLMFFIIPLRLETLAYVLVVISILSLFAASPNAGGEAAHLGGALAGFYFIRRPQHLHGFFDILGRVDPTSHHYRGGARAGPGGEGTTSRREVDRILDKIKSSGLQSLTAREKRVLRDASRD